jgi:hypothetical protein
VYTLGAAPAPAIAPRVITVTPTPVAPPIVIHLKNALLDQAYQKTVAASQAKATAVKTGITPTFKLGIMNTAMQKMASSAQAMAPAARVSPSVLEQTGLNPPVVATPVINPSSPFSIPADSGGGGGGGDTTSVAPAVIAPAPAVQEAGLFPDTTSADQMAQVDQAAAAGDLSAQEVASIKSDIASKTPAVPTSWIPVVLLAGLVAVSLIGSRRTGGRIGRRGWGN